MDARTRAMDDAAGMPSRMPSAAYHERRAWIGHYFDRTASAAWQALTSDAPVSRVRASVRAGRDEMRRTLRGWLPADLRGARVLDAGCGTGVLAIELAQSGADVVAVDLSESLTAHATERAAGQGVGNRIRFVAGDMLSPAFGQFDYVVAMDSVIHYELPEMLSSIAELASRAHHGVYFTVAPMTPVFGTLLRLGKLFPARDRAPSIVPIGASRMTKALAAEPSLASWTVSETKLVQRGFYRSRAYRLQRAMRAVPQRMENLG